MIVITSAMKQETGEVLACLAGIAAVVGRCPSWRGDCAGEPVTAVCTGVGREAVVKGLGAALAEDGITAVLSTGFAGGLTADLLAGDIVVSEATLAEGEPERYAADEALLRKAERVRSEHDSRVVRGTAVTIPAVAGDMKTKHALWERTGADICEMEDYWAAGLAAERGIPFLSVRVVIDELTTDVGDFTGMMSPTGVRPLRVTGYFLTRPQKLAKAVGTWRKYRTARASLRQFMKRFLAAGETGA